MEENKENIVIFAVHIIIINKFQKLFHLIPGYCLSSTTFTPAQTIAAETVKRIDTMYHLDNKYKYSSAEERLDNRQHSVLTLDDAYFAWLKGLQAKIQRDLPG